MSSKVLLGETTSPASLCSSVKHHLLAEKFSVNCETVPSRKKKRLPDRFFNGPGKIARAQRSSFCLVCQRRVCRARGFYGRGRVTRSSKRSRRRSHRSRTHAAFPLARPFFPPASPHTHTP